MVLSYGRRGSNEAWAALKKTSPEAMGGGAVFQNVALPAFDYGSGVLPTRSLEATERKLRPFMADKSVRPPEGAHS